MLVSMLLNLDPGNLEQSKINADPDPIGFLHNLEYRYRTAFGFLFNHQSTVNIQHYLR
jgi:hypothetical protein